MILVKDQNGKEVEQEFRNRRDAASYCKVATSMFSELILSVYENADAVSHFRQGKKIYSVD